MDRPQKKKQPSRTGQITALIILGLVFLCALINLSFSGPGKDKTAFSAGQVLNGVFADEYEDFRRENVRGKKIWDALDESVQVLLGKRKSNGVYKGKDHYLMEEIAAPDTKSLEKNIAAIREFDNMYYNIPTYFMLVPNAANVLEHSLPGEATTRDQKEQFETIRQMLGDGIYWVDVQKRLAEHQDEKIYYHTDSRWTTLGAKYGYDALGEVMGFDASKSPEMGYYVVTNDFNGNLAEKSGFEKGFEDSITIYTAKKAGNNTKVIVTNMDTDQKSASLYDVSALETRHKYNLFLGGDCGMLDIRTTADTTDRLLILKDSYANCLIPMLTPYYREIVAVDPALYEGNLQEVMQNTKFTAVLFLYNGNSFVTDTSIANILKSDSTQEKNNASE